MATASGQLEYADYDQELVDAGFSAISPGRRGRWINFGYRRIANRYPWLWEKLSVDVVLNPGEFSMDFTTDIPNFRSLERIYTTDDNFQRRLEAAPYDYYYNNWAFQDLSQAAIRGEPSWYKIEDNKIYVLPPPASTRTLRVKYHQRVADLSASNTVPLTPQYLDEGILMAIFAHAHKRVHEIELASVAEADLANWLDQMAVDDDWQDENIQERVRPDNTWL